MAAVVSMVGTLLALLIVAASLAVIAGAKDAAAKLGRFVLVALALLAVVPCFVQALARSLRASFPADGGDTSVLLAGVGLLALALVGFIAWRLRAWRERARQSWRQRHLHPRRRALPPAPQDEGADA